MMLFTILVSGPLGILAAVYLVEYAKQGVLVRILRLSIETLAGIPSNLNYLLKRC
jgi:phosphate transport system permease protein